LNSNIQGKVYFDYRRKASGIGEANRRGACAEGCQGCAAAGGPDTDGNALVAEIRESGEIATARELDCKPTGEVQALLTAALNEFFGGLT